jgi:hypothetical protein
MTEKKKNLVRIIAHVRIFDYPIFRCNIYNTEDEGLWHLNGSPVSR